jgi:hypothetical protein
MCIAQDSIIFIIIILVKPRGFTIKPMGYTAKQRGSTVKPRGFTVKPRYVIVKICRDFNCMRIAEENIES